MNTEPYTTAFAPGAGRGAVDATIQVLSDRLIAFLETGDAPEGLFAPNVFLDFTMPCWRLQATSATEAVALRRAGHPSPGRVPRSRLDPTAEGFVLEVEEEWVDDDGSWYCREMFRADVADGLVSQLSVYCTGDWDERQQARHADEVALIRP